MKKVSSLKELLETDVIIVMEDNDGKELARFDACEFSIKKAIPFFYDYVLAEYGRFLSLTDINQITADTFDVSIAYIRDIIREDRKSNTNKGAPNNGTTQGNQRQKEKSH